MKPFPPAVLARALVCLAAALALAGTAAPAAAARAAHTVQPGETLWSIAAASNLTTHALASSNGLSESTHLIAGQTIWIPSPAEATATLADHPDGAPPPSMPAPMGAYTVRLNDTLSSIAARSGVSVEQVAFMNGLEPGAPLLAGTALRLPPGSALASHPSSAPTHVPGAGPQPTDEFVSPALVQQIALEHGVPPSLAAAIAKMESGFSNGVVSSANARGVMQILPGTWDFVRSQLGAHHLQPSSARDNVHAGVMYLGQLLRDTGGDESAATAAYYQGLSSVRNSGPLPMTQRYVANVMALRSEFGGP